MSEAAAALEFEKAARLRDRISRAVGDPGRAERQSALDPRGRRVRRLRGGGAILRRGVLLPHLPELGQPRLFSPRRPGARARRGARRLSGAVLSRAPGAAARASEPRGAQRRDALRGLERARRPPHRHRRAAARREEGSRRRRHAQRARGAVAQARRSREPGEAASPRSGRRSASSSRSAGSRFTTIPTSWGRTRSGRWWSRGRKASSRTSTAPSTSRAPTSRPATTTR